MIFDVPTLQLVAYSALTCASVIVASVAAFLGYRQNFGWQPIVLTTSYGYGPDDVEEYQVTVEFEVWNRRKYPIAVLGQEVHFEKLTFVDSGVPSEDDLDTFWYRGGQRLANYKKSALEPNSHVAFAVTAACDAKSAEQIWEDRAWIRVYYFDPIKNDEIIIKSKKINWRKFRDANSLQRP